MSAHLGAMVSDHTEERLQRMLKTGLWGDTLGEVLEALVVEGVRRACEAGLITVDAPSPGIFYRPPETLPTPEPAPAPNSGPISAAPEILAEIAKPPPMAPKLMAEWVCWMCGERGHDPDHCPGVEAPGTPVIERDGPAYDPGMEEPAPVRGACAFCGIVHLGACDEMPF